MLKINNMEYDDLERYIKFLPINAVIDGKRIQSKALYISFKTNKFNLDIETSFVIESLKKLKEKEIRDISKYIIGLPYEDEKGWIYLTDRCNCIINRISNNTYKIHLDGIFIECGEELNIMYDDIFEI